MNMMKQWNLGLVAAAFAAATQCADAAQGDWLARVRVIRIDPTASSSLAGLDVSSETAPEIDLSYFLTDHVALELIATDKRFGVSLNGASLGSLKLLPPTLTIQYHFRPAESFRPYVGAGVNYTRFHDASLSAGGTPLSVDNSSWGGALQAGFDVAVSKNMVINVDVKKIYIDTDVKAAGATLTNLKIDPVVFGAGVGWKF